MRVGGSLVVLGFVVVPFVRVVESICGRYGSRWSTVRVAVAAPRPQASGRWPQVLRAANELRDRVASKRYLLSHIHMYMYVEGTSQLADILTKPLGPASHRVQLARVLEEEDA